MDIQLSCHRGASAPADVVRTEAIHPDSAAQADRLFRDGIREVVFTEPVRLPDGGPTTCAALGLLRELGAWGVACRWVLLSDGGQPGWLPLSHLPPPVEASDGDGPMALDAWCDSYFPCKCLYREGPGFIQIRDRRSGVLDRYTVDDPAFVEAVRALSSGADPERVDRAAVEAFVDSGLIVPVGDLLWWAPARVRRWPIPAMVV